jgi:phosphoribosylformylglycinamidine synthase
MSGKELSRKRPVPFPLYDVDLFSATPVELKEMSKTMGLNLSLEEIEAVKAYFKKEGRLPTDVELQSIAQAWSEHCCYKSSKCFLREHIFGIKTPMCCPRATPG